MIAIDTNVVVRLLADDDPRQSRRVRHVGINPGGRLRVRQPVGKRPCGRKRTLESPTTLLVGVARQKIVGDDLRPPAEVRALRRCVGPHCRVLRDTDQLE